MGAVDTLVQVILSGLLLGGIYGIASVGISFIYGVMEILNASHGELIILGAYIAYWLFWGFGLNPFLSVFFALLIGFIVGVLIQRVLVNRLIEFPMAMSFIVTYGLAMCLDNLMIHFWTIDYRAIQYPSPSYNIFGATIPLSRIQIFFVALIVFVLMQLFLARTNVGRAIRAVSQNKEAARLMGIPVGRTYMYVFGLSSALAAIGGVLIAVIFPFNPLSGRPFLLKAFSIVVLGGLGSIIGSLVGGIIVGVTETAIGVYAAMTWKDLGAYILLLIILMIRPQGILGKRARRS